MDLRILGKIARLIRLRREMKYEQLPYGLVDSIQAYVETGRPVGSFLEAVISNDLSESFGRADHNNRHRMFDIVSFIYNEMPAPCWGSKKKYEMWIKKGGFIGS